MMDTFNTLAAHWDEILMAIGAIGVACESLFRALAVLARVLKKVSDWAYDLAGLTATQVDDSVFWRLSIGLEVVAAGLEKAAAWVPRLRPSAKAKRPGPGLGTSALTGIVIGLLAVGMVGCGGRAERATRTALSVSAHALLTVDEAAVAEIRAVELRCVEAPSYVEWRACMEPAYRLTKALGATQHALLAAEGAVDVKGADGLLGTAGCVSAALDDVRQALRALDLPIPGEVMGALETLSAFGRFCNAEDGR